MTDKTPASRTPQSWDQRYQTRDLPWDSGEVDENLLHVLEQWRQPEFHDAIGGEPGLGAALEIGCGTGTNAIALARHGFGRVTATDLSPTAIAMAQGKSLAAGAAVAFKVHDILDSPPVAPASVDLVFDRGVFHVVPPESRKTFAQRVAEALRPGGLWLSLAGNADDTTAGGPPRLTAGHIVGAAETLFQVISLQRSRFNRIRSEHSDKYHCWRALMRKR